jgi:FG-GAP-like repeat
VTLTLDFSILQAVRILTVKSLSVGLDFHVWCQGGDGRLRPVGGLDLSGKFRLDLSNLRLGQLSQFAGDFDGDGRADFVQMGRGRKVTIHRGRAGCSYPSAPDATVELAEEPRDLSLARVEDLDGDGRTDLLVIQPQRRGEPGVSRPVRLDLYLSGDGG